MGRIGGFFLPRWGWRVATLIVAGALGLAAAGPRVAHAFQLSQVGADPLPRIKALREAGRLADALEAATAAIRAAPKRPDLRMERGIILGGLGRYAEALAEYETLLAENPQDVPALLEHAQVKLLQGKYDEAEGEFRFVLALVPGQPGASFGLGDVLTWKGELAAAREAYRGYVRAQPDDPRGHLRLGHVALLMGDAAEARARFGEALRLDPANAAAQSGLARADQLAARAYRIRYEVGYAHETLSHGQPDWRRGSTLLTFRLRPGTQFHVGAQHFTGFGQDDQLVTAGFAQQFFDYVTLSGSFSQGLNGRILPKQIYDGQLTIPAPLGAYLFTGYSFSDFNGNVTAGTLSPGIYVGLPFRFSLMGRYFRTEVTRRLPSNAFLVQLAQETTERFQPYFGVARGGLAAGALTSAELRNANARYNSAFGGFSWRIVSRAGIKADYAYQTVKQVYVKHTFGLTTFFEY